MIFYRNCIICMRLANASRWPDWTDSKSVVPPQLHRVQIHISPPYIVKAPKINGLRFFVVRLYYSVVLLKLLLVSRQIPRHSSISDRHRPCGPRFASKLGCLVPYGNWRAALQAELDTTRRYLRRAHKNISRLLVPFLFHSLIHTPTCLCKTAQAENGLCLRRWGLKGPCGV